MMPSFHNADDLSWLFLRTDGEEGKGKKKFESGRIEKKGKKMGGGWRKALYHVVGPGSFPPQKSCKDFHGKRMGRGERGVGQQSYCG